MLELPFGFSIPFPQITHREWLQILVAISVPMVMYRVTKMSQVLTWVDITITMGLVMTPIVFILALQGILNGAAVIGILSAIMLSSLGIIVTD